MQLIEEALNHAGEYPAEAAARGAAAVASLRAILPEALFDEFSEPLECFQVRASLRASPSSLTRDTCLHRPPINIPMLPNNFSPIDPVWFAASLAIRGTSCKCGGSWRWAHGHAPSSGSACLRGGGERLPARDICMLHHRFFSCIFVFFNVGSFVRKAFANSCVSPAALMDGRLAMRWTLSV